MKLLEKFNHIMATEGYEHVKRNLSNPRPRNSVAKMMIISSIINQNSKRRSNINIYNYMSILNKHDHKS